MAVAAGLSFALSVALLVASYMGAAHPLGDSLAVIRPVLAVAAVLFGWGLIGAWSLVVPVALALPLLWPAAAPQGPTGLTLYQKNLSFRLDDTGPLVRDIKASGADVVTLQELHNRLDPLLEQLADSHPHQHLCDAHPVGRVAILSKYPFTQRGCVAWDGLAHARVATETGDVTVVALHLHWPYPYGQASQVGRLTPTLSALPQPMIVAGDFNTVPGTHTIARISRATGTRRAALFKPTFWLRQSYPITIDHILLPKGWRAAIARRPLLGSDHLGLIARIAQPAQIAGTDAPARQAHTAEPPSDQLFSPDDPAPAPTPRDRGA